MTSECVSQMHIYVEADSCPWTSVCLFFFPIRSVRVALWYCKFITSTHCSIHDIVLRSGLIFYIWWSSVCLLGFPCFLGLRNCPFRDGLACRPRLTGLSPAARLGGTGASLPHLKEHTKPMVHGGGCLVLYSLRFHYGITSALIISLITEVSHCLTR